MKETFGMFWPFFRKPTPASVTSVRCRCEYLERGADDPDSPIVFDELTGEFHFRYTKLGDEQPWESVLYHCPFCGGAAPPSKRALLFKTISRREQERLAEILRPLKTIADCLQVLGEPDEDELASIASPADKNDPPESTPLRTLRYDHLSDDAHVMIYEWPPGGAISWTFVGKPLASELR